MLQEFKKFIMRGNILDLAVAVIIGGAFNKIVASFVSDILMPPIGYLLQGVDFKDLVWKLTDTAVIKYGLFIQTVIDFLIVAASVFMVIKVYNKIQAKKEEKKPEPSNEEKLLGEIRDLLKNQSQK